MPRVDVIDWDSARARGLFDPQELSDEKKNSISLFAPIDTTGFVSAIRGHERVISLRQINEIASFCEEFVLRDRVAIPHRLFHMLGPYVLDELPIDELGLINGYPSISESIDRLTSEFTDRKASSLSDFLELHYNVLTHHKDLFRAWFGVPFEEITDTDLPPKKLTYEQQQELHNCLASCAEWDSYYLKLDPIFKAMQVLNDQTAGPDGKFLENNRITDGLISVLKPLGVPISGTGRLAGVANKLLKKDVTSELQDVLRGSESFDDIDNWYPATSVPINPVFSVLLDRTECARDFFKRLCELRLEMQETRTVIARLQASIDQADSLSDKMAAVAAVRKKIQLIRKEADADAISTIGEYWAIIKDGGFSTKSGFKLAERLIGDAEGRRMVGGAVRLVELRRSFLSSPRYSEKLHRVFGDIVN